KLAIGNVNFSFFLYLKLGLFLVAASLDLESAIEGLWPRLSQSSNRFRESERRTLKEKETASWRERDGHGNNRFDRGNETESRVRNISGSSVDNYNNEHV
ncbi:hypothetical protein DFH27DRAFT_656065, partial [Peziza echinospora]